MLGSLKNSVGLFVMIIRYLSGKNTEGPGGVKCELGLICLFLAGKMEFYALGLELIRKETGHFLMNFDYWVK